VSIKDAEHFARRMAPNTHKGIVDFRKSAFINNSLQMYSVRTVEELNVLERWKTTNLSGHWRHLLAYAQAMKYLLLTFTNVARVLMVWWQVPQVPVKVSFTVIYNLSCNKLSSS